MLRSARSNLYTQSGGLRSEQGDQPVLGRIR